MEIERLKEILESIEDYEKTIRGFHVTHKTVEGVLVLLAEVVTTLIESQEAPSE